MTALIEKTPWWDIPPQDRIRAAYGNGQVRAAIAAKYGLSVEYINRMAPDMANFLNDIPNILRMQTAQTERQPVSENAPDVQGLTIERLERPPTYLYGVEPQLYDGLPIYRGHDVLEGNFLVMNDLHIPCVDMLWLEYAVQTALRLDIENAVVIGDWFNADGVSRHPKRGINPFGREIEMGAYILEWLTRYMNVRLYPGNHDDWFLYRNEGHISFKQGARMMFRNDRVMERVAVSEYDRVTLINAGNVWTCPHQANYSKDALKVGDELAQKYQSNVIIPHQHITGMGPDRYNRYVVIDSGGMFDPDRFGYVNLKTSKSRNMNQAFVTLVDGLATLWTPDPRITDWSRVGLEPPPVSTVRQLALPSEIAA